MKEAILGDLNGNLHYHEDRLGAITGIGRHVILDSEGDWQRHFELNIEQGILAPKLLWKYGNFFEPQRISLHPQVSESSSNKNVRIEKLDSERIVTFREITYRDQILKLKSPINVEGVLSDDGCSLYYEPLDIFISAFTLDECEEDFQEVLDFLFEQYAMEADENLTEGAQELKRKLLELSEEG